MNTERKLQIYAEVNAICLECREQQLSAEQEIRCCEKRVQDGFPDSYELALALELLKQWLRRNPPVSTDPPPDSQKWERWKVIRDSEDWGLLGGFIDIDPVDLSNGAVHCTVHAARDKRVKMGLVVKCLRDSPLFTAQQKIASTIHAIQEYKEVRHPNLVRVFDGGLLEHPDSGHRFPFILMEQIEGCTLDIWAMRHPCSAPATSEDYSRSARVVKTLAVAVRELHKQDPAIIHFDLKPQNVMVSGGEAANADESTLKIIDFTVFPRDVSEEQVFTAEYAMPGRQSTNEMSGKRGDVFALGAILYFLIANRHPALDEHGHPVIDCEMIEDDNLSAVVRLAATPRSDGTFASYTAAQMADDLDAALTGHPLPHARQGEYSWWDREKLLLGRLATRNDQRDHVQAIARIAIPAGALVAANGFFHSLFVYSGMAPEVAVTRANYPTLGLCSALFLTLTAISRGRMATAKIVEPLYALILSCVFLPLFIVPHRFGASPAWESYNVSINIVILIVGVILVGFGALAPEWRSLRWFGWGVVLTAPIWRYVFTSSWSDYAGPVVCGILEAIACFLFARLLWRGDLTLPENEQSPSPDPK